MKPLDLLHLCYLWCMTYPRERQRWLCADEQRKNGSVRVFYGYEQVPGPDQKVFGGMVKLQDLQGTFANHVDQPNILYLISSALPYFPVRMAQMAKRAGVKLVLNQNGVAYPGWHGPGWEKTNQPMQELTALADYILYQSEFCKLAAETFLGEYSGSSEVLYNAVDTDQFISGPKKEQNEIVLLLAGSHWSQYRPFLAIEALQKVLFLDKRVRLRIAGRFCWEQDTSLAEKQVREFARHAGVDDFVEYTGSYSQHEAVSLLQSADILLHTKYNDPCPRLVLEAMSCGLPIVYSATGGVPELVGNEAGVGVPGPLDWQKDHPPTSDALAEAVVQVLAGLPDYAVAARKRAVHLFDRKNWIERHREIFTACLDSFARDQH
ncbi:MAG: glycosyltransferase family 4 protein [Candidatus Electrothrix aestuarii]|uniref:Glycosyltransferase family 4 protein n=1 Tax=Candidatus Electrothrix aestuarii TaxID=3062594 RepID=A0AAU8LX13_9BACT|nr:glycosyltransferase family 4 protein [Candidatus Electrothrix aestuarii]